MSFVQLKDGQGTRLEFARCERCGKLILPGEKAMYRPDYYGRSLAYYHLSCWEK